MTTAFGFPVYLTRSAATFEAIVFLPSSCRGSILRSLMVLFAPSRRTCGALFLPDQAGRHPAADASRSAARRELDSGRAPLGTGVRASARQRVNEPCAGVNASRRLHLRLARTRRSMPAVSRSGTSGVRSSSRSTEAPAASRAAASVLSRRCRDRPIREIRQSGSSCSQPVARHVVHDGESAAWSNHPCEVGNASPRIARVRQRLRWQ